MAIEIEHKFLLANEDWRNYVIRSVYYKQGYLGGNENNSIRVRVSDEYAWLNLKSAVAGAQRLEFEYEIPLNDADIILEQLCFKPYIEKYRHFVQHAEHLWEIDEFLGDNAGLIVAEIELSQLGESFVKPDWLGQEVTDDLRYYNNNLTKYPYKDWNR